RNRAANLLRACPPKPAKRAKEGDRLARCDRLFYTAPLPVGVLRDLVLFQLFIEITARRPDHFGGLRDVPAVLAQLADEERALGVFLELAERAGLRRFGVARGLRGRAATERRRRSDDFRPIGQVDRVAAGHDDHPLDGVAQLADVPLPPVPLP